LHHCFTVDGWIITHYMEFEKLVSYLCIGGHLFIFKIIFKYLCTVHLTSHSSSCMDCPSLAVVKELEYPRSWSVDNCQCSRMLPHFCTLGSCAGCCCAIGDGLPSISWLGDGKEDEAGV
jgi:hypothetical protein